VPENAFLRSSGYDWQCDRGYRQDRETCVPIVLPDNAYLTDDTSGSGWTCERGFTARSGDCVPIAVPENGYLTNADYGDEWACERGFFEIDGRCDPVALPANAFLDPASYGPGWRCERGFETVRHHLRRDRPARQTRISIDQATVGAATAAFNCRMGSAFLDDRAPRSDHGDAPGIRMRIGCRLKYRLTQPTPLIAMLNVHYSRFGDLERADYLVTQPSVPLESYRDGFGNWCTRMVAPAGDFTVSTDGIFRDCGLPDPVAPDATQAGRSGSALRDAGLSSWQPLLRHGSSVGRGVAPFESTPPGWARVQAICDFVHTAVSFDYMQADATRTASQTLAGREGCLPGLRPSRDCLVPLHEHPGPLLHRVSERIRRTRASRARTISRPGWRSGSTAAGGFSIRATTQGAWDGS
jgi:hypothetical protein